MILECFITFILVMDVRWDSSGKPVFIDPTHIIAADWDWDADSGHTTKLFFDGPVTVHMRGRPLEVLEKIKNDCERREQ